MSWCYDRGDYLLFGGVGVVCRGRGGMLGMVEIMLVIFCCVGWLGDV